MRTIDREELKAKLERGEALKLIMALDRHAYERMHLPGSLYFDRLAEAAGRLNLDDEIVVYCSNPACHASRDAYHLLRSRGFKRLYRYAGGLEDWSNAGYPLEGGMA